MRDIQRAGGKALLLNTLLSIANLALVLGVLGPDVLADRARLVDIAINHPAPLLALDVLKLVSAAAALVAVLALFRRLQAAAPDLSCIAAACGVISVALLLANAVISYTIVSQSAVLYQNQAVPAAYLTANAIINALGFAALFANGGWYLLVSWAALKGSGLPRPLNVVGLVLGLVSLLVFVIQPLALLVLALSLIWSAWLGTLLVREPTQGNAPAKAQV
jgi:hypothetical protein